nr:hypothetical protein [Mannheimia granulomatis]
MNQKEKSNEFSSNYYDGTCNGNHLGWFNLRD